MTERRVSYFDVQRDWNDHSPECLIRGFELEEVIPPARVHNGEKSAYPWPWLFIYFHDEAFLDPGTPEQQECTNKLMIWRPGTAHRYGNEQKSWKHSWLIADLPEMEQLLESWSIPVGTPFAIDAGGVFAKYLPMFQEELDSSLRDSFYLSSLLRLFIYDLHRLYNCRKPEIPLRIRQMAQFLENHISAEISSEEIAGYFGMSVPHFTALFREYYHIPPKHYLNRLRMIHASKLLTFYSYSCKEVAGLCGFADPLYFSRRFRQYWGVSPREYRQKKIL